ncbi:MAG: cyclopropane-fatty-acyl-phospholipid synthase [Solirubrobacteraceae bacterium]|nr:cyclopropane-fatty-acyl-phospholipid synthase [Solirubrobacteraceae bacterium]
MAFSRPDVLRHELEHVLPDRPFTVRFWDGSELPSTSRDNGTPTFSVRSPKAIAHLLRAPGQLGLGRAYVSGEIAVDDMDAVARLLATWSPPEISGAARRRLMLAGVRAAGIQRPPAIPEAELRPEGRRHSLRRDSRSVRHHYDLSNDFFALFLDDSMTYSCAIFESPEQSLEDAQANKRETVCRKLALQPGMRVLDVGCGWGSLSAHMAERGAEVVGITLSEPQAARARLRAEEHGVADKVEIRVLDYRELRDERFDAIASIGMVEHVGAVNIDAYLRLLAGLLEPGGVLLNHGIARLRHTDGEAGPFSERYVFADAAPLHLSRIQLAVERAGLVTNHVEGYAEHYARTLTRWLANLESDLPRAEALVGPERVNVWRLYLRAARNGFETGFTSIYQVRAVAGA